MKILAFKKGQSKKINWEWIKILQEMDYSLFSNQNQKPTPCLSNIYQSRIHFQT